MVLNGNFTNEFTEVEYNRLIYSLEILYGAPSNINSKLGDPDFKSYGGKVWQGIKVKLEILRLKLNEFPKITGYISITERSVQNKMIFEDF